MDNCAELKLIVDDLNSARPIEVGHLTAILGKALRLIYAEFYCRSFGHNPEDVMLLKWGVDLDQKESADNELRNGSSGLR